MAWDSTWESVFASQAWGKYPGEELIRFVARNFYKAPERSFVRILEVGCGPGANLWFIAREGFSAHGIDGSPSAISQAKARLDTECPGWHGEVRCGDFSRLEFPDAMFDAVIDNEAVYCNDFDSSCEIYKEMARVTKPGGKLFCRTFAAGSWGDGTGEALGRDSWRVTEGPLAGKGFSRFTRREDLPALLSDFAIDDVELLSRTTDQQRHTVREWIVTATR